MKSSLTVHQINLRRQGFTLAELSAALFLFMLMGVTAFDIFRGGLILSSTNLGINVSAFRGRQMIDQIGEITRYSLFQPTLVNASGAAMTGSADGIIAKKFLGTPYIVLASTGLTTTAISTSDTSFVLKFRTTLPVPQVGDSILMETLSRPELEITSVNPTNPVASGGLYTVTIGTATAIGDSATPSTFRVTGDLYHKHGFVFVATDSIRYELRHFELATSGTSWATNTTSTSPYRVLASGYQRLSNQSFFTNSTSSNNAPMTTLTAIAYSSSKTEYVARGNNVSAFTSVPMQVRLWAINN